ncbi:hypothetical protein MJD09_16915 [bacterium]|nr:hypothetical protein [bacterium]
MDTHKKTTNLKHTLTLVCLVVMLASVATAQTLSPTSDRHFSNSQGLQPENVAFLAVSNAGLGLGPWRTAMEFNISSVTTVTSAVLTLHPLVLVSQPTFRVHGYSGDGAVTTADFLTNLTEVSRAKGDTHL